mmetsp:Transcript_14349/g.29288  ORF Transcript_14349/g.29288 Transcript_14349/m.29288 type:complete len:853 (-) Transcript_14349:45-2603(-)
MQQRRRSQSHLFAASTPSTQIGAELQSIKSSILPALFEGLEIKKAKSNGKISTRVLSLSDDLFKLFLSRTSKRQLLGKRAVSTLVGAVMATKEVDCTQLHVKVIDIADILFVQSGFIGSRKLEAAATLAFRGEKLDPAQVVSIFHGTTTTDFILKDDEDRKALLSSIQIIRDAYHKASMKPNIKREQLLLRYAWFDVDLGRHGVLDLAGFLRLLRRINVYIKQEKATKIYRDYYTELHSEPQYRHSLGQRMRRGSKMSLRVDRGSNGHRDHCGINFHECTELFQRIKSEQNDGKQVCDLIFNELFGEGRESVTAENIVQYFLIERQGNNDATTDEAKNIIRLYGSRGDGESIDRMSFGEYLFSSGNDLFDPAKQRFDERVLNESLSEYFINSSHNTYLTGDQIQSKSSLEAYAVALHRGCKCLELDCFDGDKTGAVVVYHSYTATSKIAFVDIVRVVKKYIVANPETLPIILSLDNHCSSPFQEMMAVILKKELGEILYHPTSTLDKLPSPRDLAGKVLLKGRRTSGKDDGLSETTKASVDINGRRVSLNDRISFASPLKNGTRFAKDVTETPSNSVNLAPELAEITTFNTVRFKDFSSAAALPVTDMVSVSESKFLRILNQNEQNVTLWKSYNRQHMTRTYPSGTRLDSSNFNPVLHWSEGCQMVSLNYQTDDSEMAINDGRFRENGGCGYVKQSLNNYPGIMNLKIKVLAGSCLPHPFGEPSGEVTSPYVILRLHDVTTTTRAQKSEELLKVEERKTHTVQDNGFCPQWTDAKEFAFKVESPGVAMLQFTIIHSDEGFIDDKMCLTAIPVRCLRQGLRSVQFYDRNCQHGSFAFARLLVSVEIEQHIPWK